MKSLRVNKETKLELVDDLEIADVCYLIEGDKSNNGVFVIVVAFYQDRPEYVRVIKYNSNDTLPIFVRVDNLYKTVEE